MEGGVTEVGLATPPGMGMESGGMQGCIYQHDILTPTHIHVA